MNKPVEELIQRLKEPDYKYYRCELSRGEAELAISALEKQIPKKLIKSIQPEDVKIGNITFRKGTEVRYCPVCKTPISSNKYCGNCGQKLDWSVEDDWIPTNKYKHFNHHHELTENHQFVDFGDGEFIANKEAIPLLKALNDLGLRTRTHHIDKDGGFFSILIDDNIHDVSVRQVHERDSTRTKYNGMTEILISFRRGK